MCEIQVNYCVGVMKYTIILKLRQNKFIEINLLFQIAKMLNFQKKKNSVDNQHFM